MTLRTPRRRISPRTKRRYRAIREFFRRALGSTSQQEIKINSSIAVNVTDLKRKIVGLEQQIDEVNKHCRDFACLEDCSRIDSRESNFQYDFRHEIDTIKEQTEASSEKKSNGLETQFIYQSSDCNCKKSEDCDSLSKPDFDKLIDNHTETHDYPDNETKVKVKKSKTHNSTNTGSKLQKHKTRLVYENTMTAHSTSSFHSLINDRFRDINTNYPSFNYEKKKFKNENLKQIFSHPTKEKKYKEFLKKNMGDHLIDSYEAKPITKRKNKVSNREIDPDFIESIIRKQYKPVKTFGRKPSDFSQFSAPVCRDQEFPLKENIQEGSELCSCFYPEISRRQKRSKRQDLNGMRSVCDTRLYSSNKHHRHKLRRMHVDTFSNSDMYDMVPVKERPSPKSRRKFIDSNMSPYEHYREVPPSPRSLRPRLNLQAQYYTELEEHRQKLRKRYPRNQIVYPEYEAQFEVDTASEFIPERNMTQVPNPQRVINVNIPVEEKNSPEQNHQETGTVNSLPCSQYINEQTSTGVDTSLNKTQETEISVDKTDKALCEIKDILQSFLHEIKKDTVASQCDKSDFNYKTQDNDTKVQQKRNTKISSSIPTAESYNHYGTGQCGMTPPCVPPFPTNTCCYQVMPVCPINYPMQMQNGAYLMPSHSYTCTNCVTVPKESTSVHCCNKNIEPVANKETDELIKEIYKFVAQGTVGKQGQETANGRKRDGCQVEAKTLTSRSVGGSIMNHQHDAKVGTQPLKCYSKSCEAIGSRMVSDTYYTGTNASYSDTLLEKLSLEGGTHSTSETDMDLDRKDLDKNKHKKLSKVFRSIGLFKKKKKHVIEELSESESVTEDYLKPKPPPFRQNVTNYVVHGQDYYRPPPLKPLYERRQEHQPHSNNHHRRYHDYQTSPHEFEPPSQEYHPHEHEYQPRAPEYQSRPQAYDPRHHRSHEYQPEYHPSADRGYVSPRLNDPYGHVRAKPQPRTHGHPGVPPPPHASYRPTAPPYSSSYDTSYSQVQPPLCLKEIEVKSTGTQSERKMSIFRKFKKKVQQPVIITHMAPAGDQKSFSTQTAPNSSPFNIGSPKVTKPLFNWKSFQEKARKAIPSPDLDPIEYSYKAQKELAHGNLKMRNAMLKKIFYKRNPFSPRNLIIKTLLGKDKSSYGDPTPGVLRPRMFF